LLLIVTESAAKNEISARKFLPPQLRNELKITEICFNPIASKFIETCLKRIYNKYRLNSTQIKQLAQSCQGDIRTALNSVRWSSKSLETFNQRDSGLSMFHGIGKILNAKRCLDADTDRSKLPSHFGDDLARLPLIEEVPEKVVEICELDSQQFLDFLHENAIDFYLDVEAAANSLEFISLGDRMNDWMFDSGADYAASLACRGYLFANPRVAKAWRPIRKSQFDWQLCKRRIEELILAFLPTFWELQSTKLLTELFPYASILTTFKARNVEQATLIEEFGTFRTAYKSRTGRFSSATNCAEMINDDEDANAGENSCSQFNVNNEVIIDEYVDTD